MRNFPNRLVIGTTLKEQIATSFFAHLQALAGVGWDIHLVSAPGHWPSGEPPVPATVHEIPMVKTTAPAADAHALLMWTSLLRRLKPAVVIGGSPKGAMLAMTAGKIAGVPRRIYLHRGARWETLAGRERALTIFADRLAVRAATDVVAVSNSLAEVLEENGVTKERAQVLCSGGSKGVDLTKFYPEEPGSRSSREPTLGYLGRLAADKRLDVMLASFEAVRNVYPEARMRLVGEIDPSDPPPSAVLQRLLATPGVSVEGWRNDAPEVLRGFDVLVFPSAREGLPNAVIEAAASGVPTVGWDVTGVRDAVANGYSGILVNSGDVEAFTSATVQLATEVRAGSSSWSVQARQWAQRFDQRPLTDAWLKLLEDGHQGTELANDPAALAVVVVTYRSQSTIGNCVGALAAHAAGCHVVVVDNSGEAEAIGARIEERLGEQPPFASLTVIDAPGNLGYAKAVNLGVSLLPDSPRYLLVLNPDVAVCVNPLTLVPGLKWADVTAGRLLGALPNAVRESTYVGEWVRAVAGVRFRYLAIPPGTGDVYVPQLAGAYLLQRLDYYRENPFDESFSLYYEDVEYCDRARGGRGVLLQDIVVGDHIGGASSGQSPEVPYVAGRVSRVRYLRARYPRTSRSALLAPFALEAAVREITKQREGSRARRRAWQSVRAEVRSPGSTSPLDPF